MKRQAGFTLIELVMVIVILGILSAFALPRFADLGNDARAASLNGALGAVKSASSIAHADALVSSQTAATGTVTLEGTSVAMIYGYPAASAIGAAAQLGDFDIDTTTTAGSAIITAKGAADATKCVFTYTQSTGTGVAAAVGAIVDPTGC